MEPTTVIGTNGQGRKIHMAWGIGSCSLGGRLLCAGAFTPLLTNEIAELPDGGESATMAVLDEHRIAVSRLCARCFGPRFQARLIAARKAVADSS